MSLKIFKDIRVLFHEAIVSFANDAIMTYAAALAYYTIFAAAPLILIAISIGGIFFGPEATTGELHSAMQGLIGDEGAKAIEAMVEKLYIGDRGVLASVVGAVALLIGATTVFGQLQESLNKIWKVRPRPGEALHTLLRQRVLSFAMILVIAFLMLISLIATAVLAGLEKFASGSLPGGRTPWELANITISYGMTAFLFGAIYKILPDVHLSWRDVRSGGLITALFFTIGKYLIGLYLGKSAIASTYGAAGAAIIILIWTYYASAVLLFGAEFTRANTLHTNSHKILPKEGAEWVRMEASQVNPGLRTRRIASEPQASGNSRQE